MRDAMCSLRQDSTVRDLEHWVMEHGHQWECYLRKIENIITAHHCWVNTKQRIFKPSSQKTSTIGAATATNMQTYTLCVDDDGVPWPPISITTVGAFSAHCQKFSDGGLTAMVARAAVMEEGPRGFDGTLNEMKLAKLNLDIHARISVSFPQALAAAVNTLLVSFERELSSGDLANITTWLEIGFLFQMQSLLSTQGNETGMLQDMSYVMDMLRDVQVQFVSADGAGWHVCSGPHKTLRVTIPVDPQFTDAIQRAMETRSESEGGALGEATEPVIFFVPCLFTLGVNENQSLANALPGIGNPDLQVEINQIGARVLRDYWRQLVRVDELTGNSHAGWGKIDNLWKSLDALVKMHDPSDKDIDLLLDSAMLCRVMGGGRATCCKSAKDRTSMASTLEFVHHVEFKGLLGRDEEDIHQHKTALLDSMRKIGGCRLRNCKLNTGKATYCFNMLQQSSLPMWLKPPPETAGGNVS